MATVSKPGIKEQPSHFKLTNLCGHIYFVTYDDDNNSLEFMKELEKLMLNYRVNKVDVGWKNPAFKQQQSEWKLLGHTKQKMTIPVNIKVGKVKPVKKKTKKK